MSLKSNLTQETLVKYNSWEDNIIALLKLVKTEIEQRFQSEGKNIIDLIEGEFINNPELEFEGKDNFKQVNIYLLLVCVLNNSMTNLVSYLINEWSINNKYQEYAWE